MNKEILEQIKQEGLEQHIPIIMDDTLEVMIDYFKKIQPKTILEIGTAIGYSSICFSNYLTENGKIDTIELDEQKAKQAIENIEKMKLQEKINVIIGNAVEILPTLDNKYDIIFIDAAKGKYPIFLENALKLIKVNGYIFADNILYKGYVMSDYNKHKQRTAVTHLREYIRISNSK